MGHAIPDPDILYKPDSDYCLFSGNEAITIILTSIACDPAVHSHP